jgi:hypothetical protein
VLHCIAHSHDNTQYLSPSSPHTHTQDILDKYELKMANAILAEEKHLPIYTEAKENYEHEVCSVVCCSIVYCSVVGSVVFEV